ncbi:MAG: hypothetical protein AAGC46_19050, partial [Solirubrobacteraceae bacterium]|nr:hypothetical protein [Patulibacter sp.]
PSVPPFIESETYPRGRRLLLVPVALIFLLGPYGSMLGGGPNDTPRWIVAILSIGVCAWLLGLGITVPRRRVTIDGDARTITVASTPPPPSFSHRIVTRSFDDVTGVIIDEIGPRKTDLHGYRVEIAFREGPALELQHHRNSDFAQDTIDHLVLLGLPGVSRSAALDELTSAPKPATYL